MFLTGFGKGGTAADALVEDFLNQYRSAAEQANERHYDGTMKPEDVLDQALRERDAYRRWKAEGALAPDERQARDEHDRFIAEGHTEEEWNQHLEDLENPLLAEEGEGRSKSEEGRSADSSTSQTSQTSQTPQTSSDIDAQIAEDVANGFFSLVREYDDILGDQLAAATDAPRYSLSVGSSRWAEATDLQLNGRGRYQFRNGSGDRYYGLSLNGQWAIEEGRFPLKAIEALFGARGRQKDFLRYVFRERGASRPEWHHMGKKANEVWFADRDTQTYPITDATIFAVQNFRDVGDAEQKRAADAELAASEKIGEIAEGLRGRLRRTETVKDFVRVAVPEIQAQYTALRNEMRHKYQRVTKEEWDALRARKNELAEKMYVHEERDVERTREATDAELNAALEADPRVREIVAEAKREILSAFGRKKAVEKTLDADAFESEVYALIDERTAHRKRFSLRVNPNLRADVARAINTDSKAGEVVPRTKVVEMSDTPDVLLMLGYDDAKIITRADILRKIRNEHFMSEDAIAEIPNRCAMPVAVFRDGENVAILTDGKAMTRSGVEKPVMVYLRPAGVKNGKHTFMASAYAREPASETAYVNWIRSGEMLYLDIQKATEAGLEEGTISQFKPQAFGGSVLTPDNLLSWSTPDSIANPGADVNAPRYSVARLYTGSAADYDRPSLVHVGTGEGSQVYGWGLYASNRRGVAEAYAKTEGVKKWLRDNPTVMYMKGGVPQKDNHVYEQTWFTNRAEGDESHLLDWYGPVSAENLKRITDGAKNDKSLVAEYAETVYGSPDKAFEYYLTQDSRIGTGQAAYNAVRKLFDGNAKAASEWLAAHDIDGIKYPVDSYGGKGVKDGDEAGWNYVSFRDDNIRVDHKWVNGDPRYSIAARTPAEQDVWDRYHDANGKPRKGWMLAPNGKPTLLSEPLWLLVRTPAFKRWFGDWENAYYTRGWYDVREADEFVAMPSVNLGNVRPIADKAGMKEAFRSFGDVRNADDGRVVRFPMEMAGRTVFLKNYANAFKVLFEGSKRAWSEKETQFEGHKSHPNIEAYHHYLNKFRTAEGEYFVRFTVREGREGASEGRDLVHAANVTDVEVYKNGTTRTDKLDRGEVPNSTPADKSARIDNKIAHFLNRVNGASASKVVDENGEPLVVYHGDADPSFTAFDPAKVQRGNGFWFADRDTASSYAKDGEPRAFFLRAKRLASEGEMQGALLDDYHANGGAGASWRAFVWDRAAADFLRKRGYDGLAFGGNTIVFDPAQIKSATDNTGAFDPANPDIRYSLSFGIEGEEDPFAAKSTYHRPFFLKSFTSPPRQPLKGREFEKTQ